MKTLLINTVVNYSLRDNYTVDENELYIPDYNQLIAFCIGFCKGIKENSREDSVSITIRLLDTEDESIKKPFNDKFLADLKEFEILKNVELAG